MKWMKVLEAVSCADEVSLPVLAGDTLLTPGEVRSSVRELGKKGLATLKRQELSGL